MTDDPASTVHMIYDRDDNLIAEADAATGVTKREYIWLGSRPIAVVVDAASPVLYHVHVDHLDRPVLMTNASGAVVWRAAYLPFGETHSITGPASLDARFPGQWFMAETGLAYNWRRWYNSNLGRYTQPDPLGMPDGPNRYAYAVNSPLMYTDATGEFAWLIGAGIGGALDLGAQLWTSGGDFGCVNWGSVAGSTAMGALFGATAPSGFLFGRGGAQAISRGYTSGILKKGTTRFG